MILKKIHLMTFGLATFRSRAGDIALPTLPVWAPDPFGFAQGGFFLRLKNGFGQDDAGEEMKFSRLPDCTATRDSID